MGRVAAAQRVEVHAVEHPRRVVIARTSSRRRVLRLGELVAGRHGPRRLDQHEGHASAPALLVAPDQRQHLVGLDGFDGGRQAVRGEEVGDLLR